MFVRTKCSGNHRYLQVVHNERIDGRVRQRVIATLGRLDVLQKTGQIDGLIASCARFAERVAVVDAVRAGKIAPAETVKIGPGLVFERLWADLGIGEIIERLAGERKFEFAVERAVFLTALHRLFAQGSDRSADAWREGYAIEGVEGLQLHHLYRAMGWLGEALGDDEQAGATGFSPRCTKDVIEEVLFARRRDLFSGLELVFFDTTSIYFEGDGGDELGQYGHSKDHRPDRKQMVVGVVLNEEGRPICCELWPGNTTDVRSLIPVTDRLRKRFHIESVCVVADRGMVSRETIEALQGSSRRVKFILGARLRRVKEIREEVLSRGGRYQEVRGPRERSKDPAPLKVKEVRVEGRRYIVCVNEEEVERDRAVREAIVESLRDRLKSGATSLVGNKGYRKYLRTTGGGFEIDEAKVAADARFDGKWVLQTDTELSASEVALKYKDLWMVEATFRNLKSVLETRPIFHKCDETIRGHVFCSFLAFVMLKELLVRLEGQGYWAEWDRLKTDLDALEEITVRTQGKGFVIRSQARGAAGKAIRSVGASFGPTVREIAPSSS